MRIFEIENYWYLIGIINREQKTPQNFNAATTQKIKTWTYNECYSLTSQYEITLDGLIYQQNQSINLITYSSRFTYEKR